MMMPRRLAAVVVHFTVAALLICHPVQLTPVRQQSWNAANRDSSGDAQELHKADAVSLAVSARALLQNTTTTITPPVIPPINAPPNNIPTITTITLPPQLPPSPPPDPSLNWIGRDASSPSSVVVAAAVGGTLLSSMAVMGVMSVFGGSAASTLGGLGSTDLLTSLQVSGAAFSTLVHHSQVFSSFAQPLTQINVTKVDSYSSFFAYANELKWITFDRLSPLHCKVLNVKKTECLWIMGYTRVLFIGMFVVLLACLHLILVKVWECACSRGMVLPALLVLPGAELAILGLLALPLSQATTVLLLNDDAKSRLLGVIVVLVTGLYLGYLGMSLWLLVMQRQHGVKYIVMRRQKRLKGKQTADTDEVAADEMEQQQLTEERSRSDDFDRWQATAPAQQSWESTKPSQTTARPGLAPTTEEEEEEDEGFDCCRMLSKQWHGTWHVDVTPAQEALLRKQYLKKGCSMFLCRVYHLTKGHYDPVTALEFQDRLSMLFWDYKGDTMISAIWEGVRLLFRVLIGVIAAMIFVGLDYFVMAIVVAGVQGFYTLLLLWFRPYRHRWVGFFEFFANGAQFVMYIVCGMLVWFDGYNPRRNVLAHIQLVVTALALIATLTRVLDGIVALEQLWYLMKRPRCLISLHGCLRAVFPCMKKKLNRIDTIAEDLEIRTGVVFQHIGGQPPPPDTGLLPPHPVPRFTPPIRVASIMRNQATPRSREFSPYITPRQQSDSTVHSGGEITWTDTASQWDDAAPIDSARTSSTPGGTRMGGPGRLPVNSLMPPSASLYRQMSDTRSYFTDVAPDRIEDHMTLGGAVDRDQVPELQWAQEARKGPLQDL